MLSVIIVTEGLEHPAVASLSSLVSGAASGLIREVVLADQTASETIVKVADVAGCAYLAAPGSRGAAFAKASAQVRGPWLLFIRAGAVLDPTWTDEAAQFIRNVDLGGKPRAGIFRGARSPYADTGLGARLAQLMSREHGLLIARDHYRQLGGHDAQAKRPEAGLLRKLGRARMVLRSRAVAL